MVDNIKSSGYGNQNVSQMGKLGGEQKVAPEEKQQKVVDKDKKPLEQVKTLPKPPPKPQSAKPNPIVDSKSLDKMLINQDGTKGINKAVSKQLGAIKEQMGKKEKTVFTANDQKMLGNAKKEAKQNIVSSLSLRLAEMHDLKNGGALTAGKSRKDYFQDTFKNMDPNFAKVYEPTKKAVLDFVEKLETGEYTKNDLKYLPEFSDLDPEERALVGDMIDNFMEAVILEKDAANDFPSLSSRLREEQLSMQFAKAVKSGDPKVMDAVIEVYQAEMESVKQEALSLFPSELPPEMAAKLAADFPNIAKDQIPENIRDAFNNLAGDYNSLLGRQEALRGNMMAAFDIPNGPNSKSERAWMARQFTKDALQDAAPANLRKRHFFKIGGNKGRELVNGMAAQFKSRIDSDPKLKTFLRENPAAALQTIESYVNGLSLSSENKSRLMQDLKGMVK